MNKNMNNDLKSSLNQSLLVALITFTGQVSALEKPKTMDEMWEIIQMQQQQINELKNQQAVKKKEALTPPKNVEALEQKTDILTEEVEKIRTQLVIPEEKELKSAYGFGPAASKVYGVEKGLSIGGYGEGRYQTFVDNEEGSKDNADFVRLVAYLGYKFNDHILFNSEIEFEHASTGKQGSVSVEFAALDFFIDPMANIRAGLVLIPMGFINPIHEPPFFFGNNRPEVERRIIPSTWRENGVGLFGQILPGLNYTAYAVNGLNAGDFGSSGIRGGRQSGSQALAEDIAFVGSLSYSPPNLPGLTVGGSAYVGNSGQDNEFVGQKIDAFTQLYEAHIQWKYRGIEFRALGSWGHIDDADVLSAAKEETVGKENFGWYAELGYNVLPLILPESGQYLAPFFRYEQLDTIASAPTGFADDGSFDKQIYQIGLQYKPIPQVVIKADYRNFVAKDGIAPDDFNLGVGFVF